YSLGKSFLLFIVGLVALILGGKIIVDNAVILARIAGMSERLIGLTIVAVGTSLPELATSIVAALKKQSDIAIGNAVGSNIFNVFWVLGITAIIKPIPFDVDINFDVLMSIVTMLLLFFFMFIHDKHRLNRWQGVSFILLYFAYLTFIIIK
ncbi:MAG: sodium:calcium antiporter, partial [Candidatus Magasanikbacteria bacterium]|nr:sodium:calcium antiporter [Candidatus Magasanikbacteria bacterium]